jgi:coproporphyrinogen III oxidase-like Fe-S oxidoreductase
MAMTTIHAQLQEAVARGWIRIEHERAQATELGRRFLNDVIASFLPTRRSIPVLVHGGPPHD